ncbi:methionine/alanine import family NSS transporter small subunit [Nocardioides sp. zg-536]|uniref:Methionine/alanine import family NSS transporter small subunit n=1 Tax=Nocardioides faecalis TaxID=2803858 RepID=A0A939BUJ9_9ACTN|nr:methionine/alanine import family NSS transporter small subunit [Nocardioides faecalis]MBM9458951.1 methionine/alanine import family NSS transporter small subunit [Nocardioides faecalis]MBS4753947.1 methionine/alanine import family NSS transporter small subunit [Nocardioides faecalis]QVI60347.1 methionine/alanine import family NSS transporter small subunit [Nocardioides faecalis]
MSPEAVVLMLVSMVILWGGLVVAVIRLSRHEPPSSLDELHRDL